MVLRTFTAPQLAAAGNYLAHHSLFEHRIRSAHPKTDSRFPYLENLLMGMSAESIG
jgi:hypothetical protein